MNNCWIFVSFQLKVNDVDLENVTHEEAVAALKATSEVVALTVAKSSYIHDAVQPDASSPCQGKFVIYLLSYAFDFYFSFLLFFLSSHKF